MRPQRGTAQFKRLLAFCLLLAALVLPLGCTWKKAGPPAILLIVIEDFGFISATCGDEDRTDGTTGFDILCSDAVRFTHAFTPSTLSQPALASILTGRYPHDHGVRNNGTSFLAAKIETVPEVALRSGYRTTFIGGGPSIWRNSGLNQGFETFDDNITPRIRGFYRPGHEVVKLFSHWLDGEAGRRSYFATLHLSDLQFLDVPTTTDLGEVRPLGFRSQLEEVSETLGTLFRRLREQNMWDNTYVVVAGLSGYSTDMRGGELQETNLHSENTRVSLFIKPARKDREGSFNWKIDANVSLVDLGATLYELLGERKPEGALVTASLRSTFEKPEAIWAVDRLILVESDWANWKGVGRRRTALRKGPFLYLHDDKPRIFNTLTDSLETSPLPTSDLRYSEIIAPFESYVREKGLLPFDKIKPEVAEKVALGELLFQSPNPPKELLERLRLLISRFPSDMQLVGWKATMALRTRNWSELGDAGSRAIQPVWSYVADMNRNDDVSPPAHPCLKFFAGRKRSERPTLRECPNPELLELAIWNDDSVSKQERQQALDRFVRIYTESLVESRIAEINYATGHAWNVPLERPAGPGLVDLILSLPSQKRFRQLLAKRISGENE